MRLFLCLKGSDKFEQEVFEALYGNQSRRDSTDLYFCDTQSGYRTEYFIDFFMIPLMWYVRFCEWLIYPTYDNGFNQKDCGNNKTIQKMWDEISQMFLIGSLSGIAVLGNLIREYIPVNLILLFVFINIGIMLLRMYLRKKLDYM